MQLDLFNSIEKEIVQKEAEVSILKDEKRYHTITEVAKSLNVNASMLRFWEKEFPQLRPKKNGKGDRLYIAEDIKLINTILYLTKTRKFTLEGCRNFLKEKSKSATSDISLIKELEELKLYLQALKKSI